MLQKIKSIKNKNILLCITGSIAAYKACELLRLLRKEGANVQVMMSKSAEKFVGKTTFSALSNNKVLTNLFSEESAQEIKHVHLSFETDLIVVAPATANIICKAAKGIADEIISTTLSIIDKPIIFAPAMNFRMWENQATIESVKILEKRGVKIIAPEEGQLASLHKGKGRLADINSIINEIKKIFNYDLILENKKVLITAGPTRETIDPIRYISNYSSGKMGYAMAKAAKYFGAVVTMISGPVTLDKIPGIEHIDVVSASDMYDAVNKKTTTTKYDIVCMSAAVADYKPKNKVEHKIKSENLNLELENTIDILKNTHCIKETLKIGFALETTQGEKNAMKKMKEKKLDYILLNYANEKNAGFDSDTNHIYLFSKINTFEEFKLDTKDRIALKIFTHIYEEEYK